ncbi:DUF3533 domain-containing protein [Streptomyces sp. NBC_01515]|uniref:YhgE/Pip domain-containing protein n=1 Tax=Streptomyces sp. NBC_01515 TaxID=2903890 RepID=UPI0038647BD4
MAGSARPIAEAVALKGAAEQILGLLVVQPLHASDLYKCAVGRGVGRLRSAYGADLGGRRGGSWGGVNADKGAGVGGKQVNLGAGITESIKKSTGGGDKIDWKVMDEKEMNEELGKGKLYGALVVPADFTSATTAFTSAATTGAPTRPTLTVLTNQSAGSAGSSLARTATTHAAESASLRLPLPAGRLDTGTDGPGGSSYR